MTEREGLFTVQTSLSLSLENRLRLEHLVRERRSDAANVVTQIVADCPLNHLPTGDEASGETIHVRLYLTPEQREAFDDHLTMHDMHLPALVSQIVTHYLEMLPAAPVTPQTTTPTVDLSKRRADLARLRARRDDAGTEAPAWLHAYIAQMEAELRRLERAA